MYQVPSSTVFMLPLVFMQMYTLYIMQSKSLAVGGVGAAFLSNRRERWLPLRSLTLIWPVLLRDIEGAYRAFCPGNAGTMLLCALSWCWWASPGTMVLPLLDTVMGLRVDTAAARVGALIPVWPAKCCTRGGKPWDQFLNQYLRSVFRRAIRFWWN